LLAILSPPGKVNILPNLFILLGIGIRLWASGYLGIRARSRNIEGKFKIANGPYRILKHPLYCGNFFLVIGTILLYKPPIWLGIALVIIFLLEYSIIIYTEEKILKNSPIQKIKFSIKNLKNEFSTLIVLLTIYLIYLFIVPAKTKIWKF